MHSKQLSSQKLSNQNVFSQNQSSHSQSNGHKTEHASSSRLLNDISNQHVIDQPAIVELKIEQYQAIQSQPSESVNMPGLEWQIFFQLAKRKANWHRAIWASHSLYVYHRPCLYQLCVS